MLRKVDEIRELFGMFLKVGERAMDISDFSFDYAGNDKNILEISFDLEFFGKLEHDTDAELITSVQSTIGLEE